MPHLTIHSRPSYYVYFFHLHSFTYFKLSIFIESVRSQRNCGDLSVCGFSDKLTCSCIPLNECVRFQLFCKHYVTKLPLIKTELIVAF